MHSDSDCLSRRDFLQMSVLGSTPLLVHSAFLREFPTDRRSVILLRLAGGNDRHNTLIPIGLPKQFEKYRCARPTLALDPATPLPLANNSRYGLHPALPRLARFFNSGRAAVLPCIEAPTERLSHFERTFAFATGHVAHTAPTESWLAQAFNRMGNDSRALCFDRELAAHVDEANLRLAVHQTGGENALAAQFEVVLNQLHRTDAPRVFMLHHPGFDTHALQAETHAELLTMLDSRLDHFYLELDRAGMGDRVCTVVYSEFGRALRENDARGTEHASSGLAFLIGSTVRGGVVEELHENGRQRPIDFRRIYAALANDWLRIGSLPIFNSQADGLPLFKPQGPPGLRAAV